MTALVEVSSHLPETVGVEDIGPDLGLSPALIRRYQNLYGLSRICRGTDTEAELLLAAAGKLAGLAGQEDRVRYLIRARTVPAAAPYPLSPLREVREALGLRHATTFALTDHACASGLLAVDAAGALLAAAGDPAALALVLVGEKAFTRSVQWIPNVTIMGEGTAAVLVRAGGDTDRMLGYATRTIGRADAQVMMTPELATQFGQVYTNALAEVITAAADRAGLRTADLDLVLPHNVNQVSWNRAAGKLGLAKEQLFLDNVPRTGHCFCADPFINYRTATDLGRLRPGDRYLMTSVGLGSIFSAMIFEH